MLVDYYACEIVIKHLSTSKENKKNKKDFVFF